jgi:hypothetical protein
MKGSIRKRGTSYTAYWSTRDTATGKRRQHSRGGFKTQKAAQGHLNTVLAKVEEGTWRPDSQMTLKTLLTEHWLPTQESRDLRPATISQYRLAVNHWIVPNIGGVKIGALSPGIVTDLVKTLRTSTSARGRNGLSSRSTQVAIGVLKSAYSWATNNGLLSKNPILAVQRPKIAQGRDEDVATP